MLTTMPPKLIVATTSRALFNLEESNDIFVAQGMDKYADYQIGHENECLDPGVAFPLVKKLLDLKHPKTQEPLVEVILLSRNSADTGLRIFNSIQKYDLPISSAAFTNGKSPYVYVKPFGAHLFLSANPDDVTRALKDNCAAAMILPSQPVSQSSGQLRIAFDGDAVLFSDDSERINRQEGLEAFKENEKKYAKEPLPAGPFKAFLMVLHALQKLFPAQECPIRTALVTARSAPAHERVIRTLRQWNVRIDEALFLGGLNKSDFLRAFGADFFFDDSPENCLSASSTVATGHVVHGVSNESKSLEGKRKK